MKKDNEKKKNKKNYGKFIPVIIAVICFVIAVKIKISLVKINNIEDILSNIINFVSITTGFLMTSLSILASTSNSRVMKKLAKFGKIKQLNIFFLEPIILAILIVLLCIVQLQFTETSTFEIINSSFIISSVIQFIVVFLRIGYLSMSILEKIMQENSNEDNNLNEKVDANVEKAFKK